MQKVELALKDSLAEVRKRAEAMSDQEIRDALHRSVELAEDLIIEMAAFLGVARDRGLDLSEFRMALFRALLRLADGATLPKIIFMFQNKGALLNKISMLPLCDQKKIADGQPLAVAEVVDGQIVERRIATHDLSYPEIRQVFDYGHIRTLDEQAVWRRREAAIEPKGDGIRIDRKKQVVYICGKPFTAAELRKYALEISI